MKCHTLGRSGLSVSQLGIGGVFLSKGGGDLEQSRGAVREAVRLGINYADTAPTYSDSESVLGRILPDIEAPLVVSTKVGGRPQPFDPRDGRALRDSIKESLALLHRDHIDVLFIHEPDRPGQYDWWTDWNLVEGPVLDVVNDLKKQGVIRAVGLGGTTAYEMAHLVRSGKFDVVLTAFNYSLLWREAENELIPAAREAGVGLIVGSPLQQGALARRFDTELRTGLKWMSLPRRRQFEALYTLLDEIAVPLPELALRFVISNPDVHCVLTGARSADEVRQNVKAIEAGPLPDTILGRLDEIAAMVPFRPYCEPFCLPFTWNHKGPGHA